jgi:hypothetical protein
MRIAQQAIKTTNIRQIERDMREKERDLCRGRRQEVGRSSRFTDNRVVDVLLIDWILPYAFTVFLPTNKTTNKRLIATDFSLPKHSVKESMIDYRMWLGSFSSFESILQSQCYSLNWSSVDYSLCHYPMTRSLLQRLRLRSMNVVDG